jgi:hypothetical protein
MLSTAAWAQQASGIAGLVRDTSGAVMPGVTVEASSPALIEKVRSVVTDGEGRYSIVDLRPGDYVVVFTLPGFSTVRREGIVLTAGFTATVNADLQVGSLEETITVTGAAPLVDTQTVRRQTALSRDLLDTLPTATKHLNTLVTLTPGFTGLADVGGKYSTQFGGVGGDGATFHGKTGHRVAFDGLGMENMSGVGNSSYQLNAAVVQEMVLETSGISAETNADGAVINVIPKEGSNVFSGSLFGLYTNDHLESSNLSDDLRARGATAENKTEKIFDEYATIGGPIVKDRLWFFAVPIRTWGYQRRYAGVYYNKTQGSMFFTPDIDRPKEQNKPRYEWNESKFARATWQVSPRNKLNFTFDWQHSCNCGSTSAATAQEAAFSYHFDPNVLFQVAYSAPLTSRLLIESAAGATVSHWHRFLLGEESDISINDQGLGITYNSTATYIGHPNDSDRYSQRFSISYVTGTHTLKTGMTMEQGVRTTLTRATGNGVAYRFNNLVPVQVILSGAPWIQKDRFIDFGLYIQDRWTVDKLTLNAGLRFDNFYGWVPAQDVPASRFLPARNFTKLTGVPSWKDLNPRVGASYDLFGTGRTALKAAIGRYVKKVGPSITGANNPIESSVNSSTRSWNDANRNYIPDCNLTDFSLNGECGGVDNQNFGKINPLANRWSDDVLRGFNVREFNWDLSTEVQHQLTPKMSLTAGYYRSWYGNFLATDNLLVGPADYDPYCITAPSNSRLPGGGGYQVCGLADIKPTRFGQVQNLVSRASDFGEPKKVNDFINLSFNTRLASGITFGGGLDTGRTVTDLCYVVDSPQQLVNCRLKMPMKGQTQLKVFGALPLPAGVSLSATLQNTAGTPREANWAAPTAVIAPSLGRNLAGGARTATVPLMVPLTEFEGRLSRLDIRTSKKFQLPRRLGLQLNFDAYNVLNAGAILDVNKTYGAAWLNALTILDARILQLSAQLTF